MGGSLAEAGLGLIAQRRPGGSLHSELTPLRGHSCRRGAGLVRGEPCVIVCTRALTYGIRPLTPGQPPYAMPSGARAMACGDRGTATEKQEPRCRRHDVSRWRGAWYAAVVLMV